MAKRLKIWFISTASKFRGLGGWIAMYVTFLAGGCASDAPAPMNTVSGFELQRYLGEWHQIAAIPAWFQSDCVANTMANYALGDDGVMEVLNACEMDDGSINQAQPGLDFWPRNQTASLRSRLSRCWESGCG